jgi:hemerythrin-like domain-containing protein
MHTISGTLTQDHHDCDTLFAEAESAVDTGDWEKARRLYEEFEQAMKRHMDVEETVLFPALEARAGGPMGPTEMMRSEHDEMRRLLEGMHSAVQGTEADDFLGLSETLLILIQQHNMKEEEVLYNLADDMLADEATDLLARMEAFGA